MSHDVENLRVTYNKAQLDEATMPSEPFAQFDAWFSAALAADPHEPNAMTVATVDTTGQPSARIVLLRGWDERGFVFFTNYESRKGRDIAADAQVGILFYWPSAERQIRIEGRAERLSAEESDAYFAKRPRGHRLSAWASPQSSEVSSRTVLDAKMAEAEVQFPGDVPRPPYWGGYRVVAQAFEFWQGRPNRVHDRIAYLRRGAEWDRTRLAP